MKFTSVEILKKEECLAIAKIIHGDRYSDDELLEYLPDTVFGETLNVDYVDSGFNVYDYNSDNKWYVPTYFVKNIKHTFI